MGVGPQQMSLAVGDPTPIEATGPQTCPTGQLPSCHPRCLRRGLVARGLPRQPASQDGAAWGVLDGVAVGLEAEARCCGHDRRPVPPHGPASGLRDSCPANGVSVSFRRCGEPGSQIHPEGSLQPVHQVQGPGVTAAGCRGSAGQGGLPTLFPAPSHPTTTPPGRSWLLL